MTFYPFPQCKPPERKEPGAWTKYYVIAIGNDFDVIRKELIIAWWGDGNWQMIAHNWLSGQDINYWAEIPEPLQGINI